jgi:hypothetical protein
MNLDKTTDHKKPTTPFTIRGNGHRVPNLITIYGLESPLRNPAVAVWCTGTPPKPTPQDLIGEPAFLVCSELSVADLSDGINPAIHWTTSTSVT